MNRQPATAAVHSTPNQADYLERNLAALRARGFAPLAGDNDGSAFRVEQGAGGQVLLWRRDTQWIALNSRRDPAREADTWLDNAGIGPDTPIVFVSGAGLGYILDAIEHRAPQARVVVFEPFAACAWALLSRRDWTRWIADERLSLWIGPDYDGASQIARLVDSHVAPPLVEHPILVHEMRDAMLGVRRAVARIVFAARANADAQRQHGGRYLLNTLRNLGMIAAESDTDRLAGCFAGTPAIIVSAGPSLDTNLSTLVAHTGRALLIAADTALRPLLHAGAKPHLVVALDPSRTNAEHLLDLPDVADVWLAAEGSVHPAALRAFAGRLFTFRVGDHHPWPWLTEIGCSRGQLDVWGSVATAAFDLARRMGCTPIVFAGQDLAYTDNRSYCSGTTWDQWGDRRPPRATDVHAVDIRGRATTTAPHLIAFRDWLVEQSMRTPDVRMVNGSGEGILQGGRIDVQPLESVLAALPEGDDVGLRTALRAAWRVEPHLSDTVRARAGALVTDGAEPLPAWRDFAGASTAPGDILQALHDGIGDPGVRRAAATLEAAPGQPPFGNCYLDTTRAVAVHELRRLTPRDLRRLCAAVDDSRADVVLLFDTTRCTRLLRTHGHDGWDRDAAGPVPSEHVRCAIVTIDGRCSDHELREVMVNAADRLTPGGTLAIVDLTLRVVGSAARRAVHMLLSTNAEMTAVPVRHSDPLTRVTLIGRRAAADRSTTAPSPTVSDTVAFARLVSERLNPSSVAVIGDGAEVWALPLRGAHRTVAVLTDVGVLDVREQYDLAIAMAPTATSDEMSTLVDALVTLSDTVVFSAGQPGIRAGARPPGEWMRSFLAKGYVMSDELRAVLDDREDFPTRSFDFELFVARRLPEDARLALQNSSALRDELSRQFARADELFMQATLLKLERQAAGGGHGDDPPVRGSASVIPLPSSSIEHGLGHRFIFRFDDARHRLGLRTGLFRRAVLEEDGTPLPHPQAYVADIAEHGGGRYTVWTDAIHLSASDNTDPRMNGRRYSLRLPAHLTPLAGGAE
jgi:hypothetical protein